VPIGVTILVAGAVAAVLTPHWRAPGLPWMLGDGKNVETAAVLLGLLAGGASRVLAGIATARRVLIAGAVIGVGLLLARADLAAVAAAWSQVLAMALLGGLLAAWWTTDDQAPRPDPLPAWLVTPLLMVLTVLAFLLAVRPLSIDVLHQGEVLSSAIDLLNGGRPFTTWLWPHGAHDTGLTAVWLALTGKVATSPVALAGATCAALGVPSLFVLARRILGTRTEAMVAVAVPVLGQVLVGGQHDGSWRTLLFQSGVLVFVVLAFAGVTSTRRAGDVVAGACLAAAYLFRIETSVYGALAVVAVVVVRDGVAVAWRVVPLLRALAASAVRLVAGFALMSAGCRVVLGFPDAVWFRYTLGVLPRYHRDAVGLPFPWPLPGAHLGPGMETVRPMALGWLVFVLMVLVQAARVLSSGARPVGRALPLTFAAVFALMATRTVLDRTDGSHVLQWGAMPVLVTVLLVVASLRARRGAGLAFAAPVVVLAMALLDVRALVPRLPVPASPAAMAGHLGAQARTLSEHLRPNPPAGACADVGFTATEADLPQNRAFIDGTCAVERVLREHGVSSLVLASTAPGYRVRFGLPPVTKYFSFARGYTPAFQRELIEDIRRARPQAMLRAYGFGALPFFDIPDAVRVPVLDAWLRARRGGVPAIPTPLGDLWLWDRPAPCRPAPAADGARDGAIIAGSIVYVPSQHLLHVNGWAVDQQQRAPLQSLVADGVDGGLEYGLSRGEVAAHFGVPAYARSGFELTADVDPATWASLQERGKLAFRATGGDGRAVGLSLPLAGARVLPAIDDPPWAEALERRREAAALGAADRAAAGAGTDPCPP